MGQTGGYRGQMGGVGEGFINAPLPPQEDGQVKPIFIVSIDFLLYRCSLLDIQRINILVSIYIINENPYLYINYYIVINWMRFHEAHTKT